MYSFGQCFLFDGVTLWAFLAGILRVYFEELPTSVFSFIAQQGKEGRPADIVNRFRKHTAAQAFHVQVFNNDGSEVPHQFKCFLVLKLFALIPDVLMRFLYQQNGLVPTLRFLILRTSYLALGTT